MAVGTFVCLGMQYRNYHEFRTGPENICPCGYAGADRGPHIPHAFPFICPSLSSVWNKTFLDYYSIGQDSIKGVVGKLYGKLMIICKHVSHIYIYNIYYCSFIYL